MRVSLLIVLSLLCFERGRIEAKQQLQNPNPVLVGATHAEAFESSSGDRNSEREFELRFMRSGNLFTRVSVPKANSQFVEFTLFRDGELITVFRQFRPGEKLPIINQFNLISPQANPDHATMAAAGRGDVSCPVHGCLGPGIFFEDYFPKDGTNKSVDENTSEIRYEADTQFGSATAWMDLEHPSVPKKILVELGANDLIAPGQFVKDFLFDSGSPDSGATSYQIELQVQMIGLAEKQQPFIKECQVINRAEFKSGGWTKDTSHWDVHEIKFDTEFPVEELMAVKIPDRQRIEVFGAPQLPYVWSAKEQWAVPDVRYAVAPVQAGRSRKFYWVAAGATLLLLGMAVYYWKSRR